ncbi:ABC transporter permease [Curtobacterium flaccumfaciens]|nr:ABC transporter permease [Curtobacterium flaccumfaciens]
MNFLDLLRTAVANTFRSKLRTTLTVIAIFIGAFTITLTSAIGTGVSNYIDTQVASIGDTGSLTITKTVQTSTDSGPAKYDPDESSQSVNRGPASFAYLSQSDVDTIKGVSGVKSVRPAVALSTKWVEYDGKGKYVVDVAANAGSSTPTSPPASSSTTRPPPATRCCCRRTT